MHQDMAHSMHAVGQAVTELSNRMGQMSQTLMEIRDSLQAAQLGPTRAAPLGCVPQAEAPPAPPSPVPTRTTRSRKRKFHF